MALPVSCTFPSKGFYSEKINLLINLRQMRNLNLICKQPEMNWTSALPTWSVQDFSFTQRWFRQQVNWTHRGHAKPQLWQQVIVAVIIIVEDPPSPLPPAPAILLRATTVSNPCGLTSPGTWFSLTIVYEPVVVYRQCVNVSVDVRNCDLDEDSCFPNGNKKSLLFTVHTFDLCISSLHFRCGYYVIRDEKKSSSEHNQRA